MALFSEEIPGLSCFGDEKIPWPELPEATYLVALKVLFWTASWKVTRISSH